MNGQDMNHDHMPADSGGGLGVHGMLLVGDSPSYLSHLPMFMSPHNYQVLLKATLEDEVTRRLRDLRAQLGPDTLVTVKPEVFAIEDLVPVAEDGHSLTEFRADVVAGHFEHGGEVVAARTAIHVDEVLYFHELGLEGGGDPDGEVAELGYLLFGDADDELFMAHRIGHRPNFDQVLRITAEGVRFTEAEIERQGHPTVTIPGRKDAFEDRLQEGEAAAAQSSAGQHFHRDLQITAEAEIYVEEDELR
jgi:hypothetical protein